MIRFENLSKAFPTPDGRKKVILDNASLTIPSGVSVALLGRNGAGKSTILELIGGRIPADSGHVDTTGTISWPVGFGGSFHGDMTGAQNVRFIARIYGVDSDELVDFVDDFAEIGAHMDMPVRTYSQGMRSRLVFGVSMGIPFDTYLVDEVMAVGDAAFKQRSQTVFRYRLRTAGAIVVSHSMMQLRKMCQAGAVLDKGRITYFDDLEEAIARHRANMGLPLLKQHQRFDDDDEDEDDE
ncbi:ABC transporter ATP-binding protein [Falsirhodobacter algicola]|uniref:ATP-binding cassette domain-containing protein n=1 Tax=Falsirhodobacter algicola TaxID=2692330 RepID=A0A8J8MTB2_9RHOB|nr:ABC transporter ATP-binding protein [Falsirhodobacter algicola]QUS36079.1 ATP-binding cassette domain-containing protein [Falsirhodobacter algicola]